MKNRWLGPVFAASALLLEALPWGVRLEFMAGPGERVYRYTSYFSMLAFGNGHFTPLLTAILTAALLVLSVTACFCRKKEILYFLKGISAAAIVCSLLPVIMWILGMECLTVLTAAVFAALLAEYIWAVALLKHKKSAS